MEAFVSPYSVITFILASQESAVQEGSRGKASEVGVHTGPPLSALSQGPSSEASPQVSH